MSEENDGLLAECVFRRDLFDRETVDRWLSSLKDLLAAICSHPEKNIADGLLAPLHPGRNLIPVATRQEEVKTGRLALEHTETPISSPATQCEQQLLAIWKEVIGVREIGLNDNFFDLGGHSVLVIQLLARIRKSFGVNLTLRRFFDLPTVKQLANEIDGRRAQHGSLLNQGNQLIKQHG